MSGMVSLLILLVWAVRGVVWLQEAWSPRQNVWRGAQTPWLGVWILGVPLWVLFAALCLKAPHVGWFAAWLLTTTVLAPWPIARALTIPLGLPRASAALAKIASWTWGSDPVGAGALAAVLAAAAQSSLARSSSLPARIWRRLAHRQAADLLAARHRVQQLKLISSAGVVAAAVLADLDGDANQADAVIDTLSQFDPRVVAPLAMQIAAERRLQRLLAGAFDDDDVDVTARILGRRAAALAIAGEGSPTVAFVQALLLLDAAPTARQQWIARGRWLLAPGRRHTLTWLRKRPAGWPLPVSPVVATSVVVAPVVDVDEAALTRALRLHVEAARQPPSVQLAVDVTLAWQRGLEATTLNARQRAKALGVDADDVVAGLTATVQQSLEAMADKLDLSAVDVATLPVGFSVAAATVRSGRLDALETMVAAWRTRIDGAVDLAPIDELREWIGLRHLVEAVARTGSDGRYVAYEAVQWAVCERAVRLWNTGGEPRFANAMFRWLLREAERVDDLRGIETQSANVRCGP